MALEPWPYRLRVNGIILPPIVKEIVAAFRRWASEDSGYIRVVALLQVQVLLPANGYQDPTFPCLPLRLELWRKVRSKSWFD